VVGLARPARFADVDATNRTRSVMIGLMTAGTLRGVFAPVTVENPPSFGPKQFQLPACDRS
jgi:hypothetical protein